MKKHLKKIFSIVSILLLTIFSNNLFSQVYLLNEDFSSASGVKPPVGWNNITVTGAASDVWRYDNPGVRQVTFPIIGTFAIFDSENYSGPGGAEKVSLETPFVDCSFSPNIILYFDHVFKSNRAGKADVEIFDGANWVIVKSFLDSVPVAKTESIDVSSLIGNKTGAKVRFTWQGDSSQYWIVDNVKLYAPLSKDVRLKTLNSPVTPVLAGVNPISITLSNEGYQTVTSATIRWTANGVAQSSYNWTGNIVRDSAQANIPIGTYNFPAGTLTRLKIWVDNPNGSTDLNKLNDTLDVNLYTALCGTYTIGGVNPDFATFNDAVLALNSAGVSCPVVFKVRDGVYAEQVKIFAIPGTSAINTVTFESESGDSSKVELHYKIGNPTNDYTLKFSGSSNVIIRGISILRSNGGQSILSDDKSSGITIERGVLNNIYVQNTRALIIRNNLLRTFGGWGVQLTSSTNVRYEDNVQECHYGIRLHGQPSDSIYIKRNTFKWVYYGYGDGAGMNFEGVVKDILEVDSNTLVQFINHGIYVNTPSGGRSKVRWNKLSDIRDYGIYMDGEGGEYVGNRILGISAGTGIVVRSRGALVANNYVHAVGLGNSKGINLQDVGSSSRILFNSVNIMGTDIVNGRALEVQGGSDYIIKNNIFANNGGGYAAYLGSDVSSFDISNNNYYSAKQRLGFYTGKTYDTLITFVTATGKDALSIDVNPYYLSDTSLVPTHALLEGAALSMVEVSNDINNNIRTSTPDIGATEFNLCANDAGVNGFWGIGNIAPVGNTPVRVELQNNGSVILSSTTIRWSINGVEQTPFAWTGNLARKSSVVVAIGNYNFSAGTVFKMRAWVTGANGQADCRVQNDSSSVLELGTQLCGTYTIGGVNPDFATFNDAVLALNSAGVSCPVVFKVRDGVYAEQVKIFAIPGTSAINTVTFESESGDSSKVELHYKIGNPTNDYTLKFSGSSNVIIRGISILRSNGGQSILSDDKSSGITIERGVLNNIYVQNTRALIIRNNLLRTFGGWGVQLTSSTNVRYEDNVQECHYGIRLHGQPSDSIYIKRNTFKWVYYGYGDGAGMNFEGVVKDILEVDSNTLVQFINHGIYVNTPSGGRSKVRWNKLSDIRDYGIYMDGEGGEYVGNRILGISAGTGIVVRSRGALVANNYVHAVGLGNSKGINLQDVGSSSRILFNSVNIMGTDIVNGRALEVQGGSDYIIKNNIFANNGGGYAAYLGSDVSSFDISNNNYYSAKQRLGFYTGKTYDTLITFVTATGKDALSIDVNPYYLSDTSLVPTHALLEGAALSMVEVSNDINNNIRTSTPDIGATEFNLCANDAGVNGFWGIGNIAPVGNTPVRVELQNNGSVILSSTTIRWSINGVEQTPFAWTGNLARKSSVVVAIGNYNFSAGTVFKMRAWVTGANGQADCRVQNDSSSVLELGTQLCGTYTIGGVNPDFATFNDAVLALNSAGVSCPVVFKVRDGVYAEQVKIFAIPGTSAINTVTFESESGDSSKVELHYKIGNPTNDYTLKFSGSSNVIIRGISILRSNGGQSILSDDKSSGITIERGVLNNIYVQNTRALIIRNNLLRTFGGWGVQLTSSTNVRYEDNVQECHYGIRLHGQPSDSIYIKRNTFKWVYYGYGDGAGMNFEGVVKDILEVDSNTLVQFINHGIYVNTPSGGRSKVRWNKLSDIRDYGIYMDGEGGEYVGNRILGISAGTGIVVRSRGALVANNYVHAVGLGNSKGINLQDVGSSSRILFNSVNIMGTDIVNGRALEVQGGSDYIIKNNIFANNGGGYAAYFVSTPGVKDIDYNNYFSTGNSFGYLGGQSLNNITSWGVALNSDANSKNLNPNYKADTALLPFQKQFNGAGISSGNILLDIDGEIRNQQAPDIGAQEFMVDFGVTRLVSPTNDCFQKDSTPVTIYLRQFGDIPFIDLKLAYQVNNGPVFKDTIPGAISNDLEYTFKRPQDMSTNGEYLFKIWLEENGDDNLNNDTLVVLRKNKNAPRVDFNYVTQCAGIGVPFTGTAAIDTGFIARIEWEFGDSTIGVGYTPSHIYDTSGTYIVTMRAFSDQGCFSEVKKAIVLKSTPITSFSVKDACFGTAVKPVNNSLIKAGGTISNYVWKWGDGQTSTGFEPTHQYAISDTFDITLIATASNGCVDSVTNKSITYSLENTAFKLNKPAQDFICEGSSLKLSASGASSYQWLFNKLPIDGAVDSVYQATKAGDYAVIFVNGLGCRSNATQPLKIKFNPIPEAKFNFDSYCVGASIQFRDSSKVDSLNRVSYSWNFGDGSPAQQVGNPVYTYTKEGEYKVSLIIKSTVCTNQADTLEKPIKVELPIKGKRYEPVTVLENKSKKLEAREFGVKYQWNPSTYLDNPNIAEPKYTAGKEQTYTIKITAKSGCITIDTLQVALYSKCDIRAPEGFSPNEDGKNDKFYPFQIGIKNMQVFRVYDRFGNLVYDDKNANSSNGWDGKHKGKKLPIGTYVWVAEGIGEDDVPVKRSGNVILIK